jgi:hypothetical protein
MADLPEGASVEDIRKALTGLVTEGLIPYNVGENGGCLLDLAIVEAQRQKPLPAGEAERHAAHAEALTSVLTEAVADETKIGGKPRRLLHDVLPLRPELLGETIKARRTEAGKNLKPGKKAVEPGTIRTYYEPKALKKLSEVLHRMETEFRAAHRDGKSQDSDEQDP